MTHQQSQLKWQKSAALRLHPVEWILLGSVTMGLLAFLGLAWGSMT